MTCASFIRGTRRTLREPPNRPMWGFPALGARGRWASRWAVAAVQPFGSVDPDERERWFVLEGTLKEADLPSLLGTAIASDADSVTLDLCDLDALTVGGCWTIRNLADDLWGRGCRLCVVFPVAGPIVELLRSTGTMRHPRIMFHASRGLPDRRGGSRP